MRLKKPSIAVGRMVSGGESRTATASGHIRVSAALMRSVGAPVNVASGEVFGWNAVKAGVSPVSRPAGRLPARVIVSPDDTVTFTDETGRSCSSRSTACEQLAGVPDDAIEPVQGGRR